MSSITRLLSDSVKTTIVLYPKRLCKCSRYKNYNLIKIENHLKEYYSAQKKIKYSLLARFYRWVIYLYIIQEKENFENSMYTVQKDPTTLCTQYIRVN